MILIRETDQGTEVIEPRIHDTPDDPTMTITSYLNGRYADTSGHPVTAWKFLRQKFLDDGYIESTEKPELSTSIDQQIGVLAVTSLFRAQLDVPGTGDPDYPVKSYVDQADAVLHQAGYLRLNNWWDTFVGLTTTVVKATDSLIPVTPPTGSVSALQAATTAIRGQLDMDSPGLPFYIAIDHLRLCEDPAGRDFGAGLAEIMRHPHPVRILSAVETLLWALDYAARGDVVHVVGFADRAVQLAASGGGEGR